MGVVLPTAPVKATRIDPAIFIMYGAKKVGKTGELTKLPGCLILDGEEGTETYDAVKLQFSSIKELDGIIAAVKAEGQRRVDENKAARAKSLPEPFPGDKVFPYRYLALDTADALEEDVVPWKTTEYKASTLGKKFEGTSVLELDHGLGYYYLREGVKAKILDLAKLCKTLIIVSHMAEKVVDKGGVSTTTQDISLTGKLGSIVCAMADAIGYVYRKAGSPGQPDKLMISFKTTEGVTMGARPKHLAGKSFEFDWAKIFIDDPALKQPSEPEKASIARSTESA
jgi:hypothetical protein